MKTDIELRRDVLKELEWDPRVDAAEIGVTSRDGVITLSGQVKSYAEKLETLNIAKGVAGVGAVADELMLYSPFARPSDTDIAAAVEHALRINLSVPVGAVEAMVHNGLVTLEGAVDWQYQRVAAEHAVSFVHGVHGVSDRIRITNRPDKAVVKDEIESAFERNADIEAGRIHVVLEGHKVILEGTVPTWSEKNAAERAAWNAEGVTEVVDHVQVIQIIAN